VRVQNNRNKIFSLIVGMPRMKRIAAELYPIIYVHVIRWCLGLVMVGVANAIHWVSFGWNTAQGIVATMLLSAVFAGGCLDALSALYTAYNRACMRLENETWLRNNCRDPVFFSNMRAHSTLCADVEANARVGAFWAAMREVADDARAYSQPLVVFLMLFVVIFVLLIPLCCLCTQRMGIAQPRRVRCLPLHHQGMCLKDV
jgi:hypothetical protein